MHFEPFERVGGIPFDASTEHVESQLGCPETTRTNRLGQLEFDYGESIFRFDNSSLLCEVTGHWTELSIGELSIPRKLLRNYIRKTDPLSEEVSGFTVGPSLGIAYDDGWITLFRRGSWDHLLPNSN